MNNNIVVGDIVKFNDTATCRAAVFCRKHGITGKILGEERGTLEVEVGFPYHIYAQPEHVIRIINQKEIPEMVE